MPSSRAGEAAHVHPRSSPAEQPDSRALKMGTTSGNIEIGNATRRIDRRTRIRRGAPKAGSARHRNARPRVMPRATTDAAPPTQATAEENTSRMVGNPTARALIGVECGLPEVRVLFVVVDTHHQPRAPHRCAHGGSDGPRGDHAVPERDGTDERRRRSRFSGHSSPGAGRWEGVAPIDPSKQAQRGFIAGAEALFTPVGFATGARGTAPPVHCRASSLECSPAKLEGTGADGRVRS